jgi:dTDP-4-dehydrorhamnose reductase
MKLLLIGANGQIGREIAELVKKRRINLYACTHQELDITQAEQVKRIIQKVKPHYIINAAAYTAVDKAEREKEIAFAINAFGVYYLAEAARQADVPLLHISTDYIFDGRKKTAYVEEDEPNPLSVYGQSKLAGETFIRQRWYKHIILRISWVFGRYGNNFVKTIIQQAKEKPELRVVYDQHGGPTYAADVAETLLQIISALQNGYYYWGSYHYSGLPMTNWYQFANAILEKASVKYPLITKSVLGIPASAYPSVANRPYNSQLSSQKIRCLFNISPKNWQERLMEVIEVS